MSESNPPGNAGLPEMPALDEAVEKLRSATEMLKQINAETRASTGEPPGSTVDGPEQR